VKPRGVHSAITALLVGVTFAVLAPGEASADPTTSGVWVTESVGDQNDPPTNQELLDMELAAAKGKTCTPVSYSKYYTDIYYVVDNAELVPVIEIQHNVHWTSNCAKVYDVKQVEGEEILSPGFEWRGWDPSTVAPKTGGHVSATISGTYATCPVGSVCVDAHHPWSTIVLYTNGRATESYGDPAATGTSAPADALPEIVPNVG